MKKSITYFWILSLFIGCSYFSKTSKPEGEVAARVKDHYLYKEDIKSMLNGLSKEDSMLLVTNYINNWAANRLLLSKAEINLTIEQQNEFNKLVENYRNDLYITAYKNALVNKAIDTVITTAELETYYEENKDNFRLNDELVKMQYIHLPIEYINKEVVEKKFKEADKNKRYLDSLSIQYKSYNLNDSIWIKVSQAINVIHPITIENKELYLKKSQFFKIEDSLGVYLVKIKDVLLRNQIAPLTYVTPTIKQIIINHRKLNFMRKLDQDIINEAIKSKDFEIYE